MNWLRARQDAGAKLSRLCARKACIPSRTSIENRFWRHRRRGQALSLKLGSICAWVREMKSSEIIKFLKMEIEPLPDDICGNRYRAAAYLTDGTYLPCVVFQSKSG